MFGIVCNGCIVLSKIYYQETVSEFPRSVLELRLSWKCRQDVNLIYLMIAGLTFLKNVIFLLTPM